ncbi:hypothetical protein ABTM60_19480, partial [Acinetobacter baumannii]
MNTQFDFSRLYMKSRWLRNIQNSRPAPLKQQNNPQVKNANNPANKNQQQQQNVLGITIPSKSEVVKDANGNPLKGKARKD